MTRTLRILDRAQKDVDAIYRWLMGRSIQGAIAWYLAFREAAREIASAGESFGVAAESERLQRECRQVLFKTRRGRTYRIVFTLTESEAIILRVRGPGQKPLRNRDLPSA